MACFSVKNYAIAKGVVPQPLANAWMVSMAFRNYPTLELMSEMLRMAQAKPSQITIFPLSIMVHNYWNNNEELRTSLSVSVELNHISCCISQYPDNLNAAIYSITGVII